MKKLLFSIIVTVLSLTVYCQDIESDANVVKGRALLESGNCSMALEYFEKAAKSGNMAAMFEIGKLYIDGKCYEVDINKVVYWYKAAAEKGYTPAQIALASVYYNDKLGNKDNAQAAKWAEEALKRIDNDDFSLNLMYIILSNIYYF